MEVTRIFDLFLDTKDSDIRVKIQTEMKESMTIPAHSFILRRASRVFEKMLEEGKFRESLTRTIELQLCGDVEDAFAFLRYLYTRRLTGEDIKSQVALMRSAHLYQITHLLEGCEKEALRLLTPFSVCRTFSLVENISSESFKNYCLDLMLKSAFLIFMNDLHYSLSEETFKHLLKSDHLNVLDEKQVLGALWKWATVKCRLQDQNTDADLVNMTGNLVPFVRWPLVRNVATEELWRDFFERFKDDHTTSDEPRMASDKVSLSRFTEILNVFEIYGTYHSDISLSEEIAKPAFIFSVSREIMLIGLSIYFRHEMSNFTELPFKIFLNSSEFTHSVSWKHSIVSTWYAGSKYSSIQRLTLEFLTPVHIFIGKINTVVVQPLVDYYYAPSYLRKPLSLGETSRCNGDVQFSTGERITAISDISYFVQK